MSYRTRFLQWIAGTPLASAATLTTYTGTQCPCMISRDANNPRYSEEWHRNNPDVEDCLQTGLIDKTTTTVNIRGLAYNSEMMSGVNIPQGLETLLPIGELQEDEIAWIGTLDTDNDSFETLDGYTDYNAKITYDANDYHIRDVVDITGIGECAILTRQG